jgi:hypothetical protein
MEWTGKAPAETYSEKIFSFARGRVSTKVEVIADGLEGRGADGSRGNALELEDPEQAPEQDPAAGIAEGVAATRPLASRPATLQLFLPRSIPSITILIGPLLSLLQRSAILPRSLREGRAIP